MRHLVVVALLGAALAAAAPSQGEPPTPPLSVRTHTASEISALLNAHLLLGEREALLIDVGMTRADAASLAARIAASGRALRTVFITNSQPDKYLGLAALMDRFPGLRVVSTPEVIADIESRGPGYLERLRRRYGEGIPDRLVVPRPIEDDRLEIEGHPVEVHRFQGGECPHAAALYVPSLRALFPGAVVFEGSHLFLRERDIPGWRRHLAWIREHGGIERIYPGHGSASDLSVLDAMERYLDDFEAAVALGSFDAALARMRERYPGYRLERLLREYSLPAYLPKPGS